MPSIHDIIHSLFIGGFVAIGSLMGHNFAWWQVVSLLILFTTDYIHRGAITPDRLEE